MEKRSTNDLFCLKGKVALITGAGGLLGPKHAEAILDFGGSVILTDYHIEKVREQANLLIKKYEKNIYDNQRIFYAKMDVTNKNDIEYVFNMYPVDILINNAAKDPKITKEGGLTPESRFETMTFDYWQQGIDAIINGTFLCSQAACNQMLKSGGGVILNISSDLGIIAPDQRIYRKEGLPEEMQNVKPITYSAAKWAIVGMTKYLAVYFAKNNIRVNCLSPTGVYNNHPEDFVQKLSSIIPVGRMADIEEYKGAIAFLCSDASSYMTGENMVIDGGKTIW